MTFDCLNILKWTEAKLKYTYDVSLRDASALSSLPPLRGTPAPCLLALSLRCPSPPRWVPLHGRCPLVRYPERCRSVKLS